MITHIFTQTKLQIIRYLNHISRGHKIGLIGKTITLIHE